MLSIKYCKNLLIAGLLLISAPGRALPIQKQTFVIEGNIRGLVNGSRVYLIQYSSKDTIAQSVSKNGRFTMRGSVPKGTEYYFLRLDSSISIQRSSEFLLVNAPLAMKGDVDKWPKVSLVGSKPNEEYLNFVSFWDSYDKHVRSLDSIKSTIMKELGNVSSTDETKRKERLESEIIKIELQIDSIKKKRIVDLKEYIKNYTSSLYISDVIQRTSKSFTLSELDEIYKRFTSAAQTSYFGENLKIEIDRLRARLNIRKGSIIPNLTFNDPAGKDFTMHEAISKNDITLIDFWASWCKPCRNQIPKIKEVYERYRKRGFGVLGIALYDQEAAWKSAIINDQTKWAHGRDVNNLAYKTFDIPAIPGYALVDRNGNLLAFNCSGSGIKEFGPPIKGDNLELTISKIIDSIEKTRESIQHRNSVPIKLGEIVPDLALGEMVNHPSLKSAHISDFKGKLLILDFWSTWCSVCIEQFPKLKKLQDQFGDKIAILPIGFDAQKRGSIREFIENNKHKPRELLLPCAIQTPQDSLLSKLFPFFGLPHEVWIDTNGRLVGITDHRAVTEENITSLLKGNVPNFSVKKIRRRIFKNSPFLIPTSAETNKVFGVAFARYSDTLSSASLGFLYLKDSSLLRYVAHNQTAITLYKEAYTHEIIDIDEIQNSKIFINENDCSFYKDFDATKGLDNWQYEKFANDNLFSIELLLPGRTKIRDASKLLVDNLDRFLNVESKIVRRNEKCLVLSRARKNAKLDIIQPKLEETLDENGYSNLGDYIEIRGNQNIDYLFKQLKYFLPSSQIMLNETGITKNIHITLKNNYLGLPDLRKQLKNYGLEFKEQWRVVEMLELKRKSQ